MGQGINTLSLELDDKEALALAQFVKRLTWSDLRGCAVDDDEAYVIKDAVDKLQRAMAEEGVASENGKNRTLSVRRCWNPAIQRRNGHAEVLGNVLGWHTAGQQLLG